MQTPSGQSKAHRASPKKYSKMQQPGNRAVQKSLDSPVLKESKAMQQMASAGANGAMDQSAASSLRKLPGSTAAAGPKKRLYNSMVVPSNIPKEAQTPTVLNNNRQQISMDE